MEIGHAVRFVRYAVNYSSCHFLQHAQESGLADWEDARARLHCVSYARRNGAEGTWCNYARIPFWLVACSDHYWSLGPRHWRSTSLSGYQLRFAQSSWELHSQVLREIVEFWRSFLYHCSLFQNWTRWSFRSQRCGHQLRYGGGLARVARYWTILQHYDWGYAHERCWPHLKHFMPLATWPVSISETAGNPKN